MAFYKVCNDREKQSWAKPYFGKIVEITREKLQVNGKVVERKRPSEKQQYKDQENFTPHQVYHKHISNTTSQSLRHTKDMVNLPVN